VKKDTDETEGIAIRKNVSTNKGGESYKDWGKRGDHPGVLGGAGKKKKGASKRGFICGSVVSKRANNNNRGGKGREKKEMGTNS